MKQLRILSLIIGVIFIFSACDRKEDLLFEESAAERLNAVKANAYAVLQAAPSGWAMEYFPNNTSAGVTFLINFQPDKMVRMATIDKYHPNYTEVSSAYEIVYDDGPVLTFNTYNEIFHIYSDPISPDSQDGTESGVGLGGDYEFIIMKIADDQLSLRGKKNGTAIMLQRLPEGQNWRGYFDEIRAMFNKLFSGGLPLLYLDYNGQFIYELTGGATNIFQAIDKNLPADQPIVHDPIPFITNSSGIMFTIPLKAPEIELSARTFKLNEDETTLVEVDDPSITIYPQEVGDFLKEADAVYTATKADMGSTFATIFDEVASELNAVYGGSRDLRAFGFFQEAEEFYFVVATSAGQAKFKIPYIIGNNNTITIASFDADNMSSDSMDTNAGIFYNGSATRAPITSLKKILKQIQGTYEVSTTEPFTMNSIKYIKSDAEYLIVRR